MDPSDVLKRLLAKHQGVSFDLSNDRQFVITGPIIHGNIMWEVPGTNDEAHSFLDERERLAIEQARIRMKLKELQEACKDKTADDFPALEVKDQYWNIVQPYSFYQAEIESRLIGEMSFQIKYLNKLHDEPGASSQQGDKKHDDEHGENKNEDKNEDKSSQQTQEKKKKKKKKHHGKSKSKKPKSRASRATTPEPLQEESSDKTLSESDKVMSESEMVEAMGLRAAEEGTSAAWFDVVDFNMAVVHDHIGDAVDQLAEGLDEHERMIQQLNRAAPSEVGEAHSVLMEMQRCLREDLRTEFGRLLDRLD